MRIFVYGTLKSGHYNNLYLEDSNYICDGKVKGYKMYTNGMYPYAVKGDEDDTISGEIFEVISNVTMTRLRSLEREYVEQNVGKFKLGEELSDLLAAVVSALDAAPTWNAVYERLRQWLLEDDRANRKEKLNRDFRRTCLQLMRIAGQRLDEELDAEF